MQKRVSPEVKNGLDNAGNLKAEPANGPANTQKT
jgi:hypothetical protein